MNQNIFSQIYRIPKGGVPRGGGSLIFPKVPQSSQTESLGFPSYPLPLDTPHLGILQQMVVSLMVMIYTIPWFHPNPLNNPSCERFVKCSPHGCQPKNRGIFTPKWMVNIMENLINMDDLGIWGYPYFWKHPHNWVGFHPRNNTRSTTRGFVFIARLIEGGRLSCTS